MRILRSNLSLVFHVTCVAVVILTSQALSQISRTNSRDLSRTIDTIIGIDIRDGKSGTYEPTTRESIVPRSRHTNRDSVKMSRRDILEELIASQKIDTRKDEVDTEDFLTLEKEERSTMPVSQEKLLDRIGSTTNILPNFKVYYIIINQQIYR